MTTAKNFLAREISGQTLYKSGAAWEYRFIKAINDLKVFGASKGGSEQTGVLTLTPTRTTIPAHAGVFVDLDLSAFTSSPTWWRECEIIWDYGNSGEVFKSAKREEYDQYLDDANLPDYLGEETILKLLDIVQVVIGGYVLGRSGEKMVKAYKGGK